MSNGQRFKVVGCGALLMFILWGVNQDDETHVPEQPASTVVPFAATPPPLGLPGALPYSSTNDLSFDDDSESDSWGMDEEPPLDFSGVNSAVDDLNSSVRRLRTGEDWEYGLPQVQRRLRNLDSEISDLEMQDMGNPDVMNMRFEADRMRREMRRLESENWRNVVPDIERRNRSLGFEADNLNDDY